MTKKRSTKNALFSSILALVLCFSMLLGTTYAWFTDSVTSKNSIIVSGNLDVDLKYAEIDENGAVTWITVDDQTELFDSAAKWEPGRTEVVYLKVSNLGSLALKYQLTVNVGNELSGTNVNGDPFKLSEKLMFKIVEFGKDDTKVGSYNRDTAVAAAGATKLGSVAGGLYTLAAKDGNTVDADYVALILYMPTEVGNEANPKPGTDAPQIELGVSLFATQVEAEFDSFGKDYDATTPMPSVPVERPDVATEDLVLTGNDENTPTLILSADVVNQLPQGVTSLGLSMSDPEYDTTTKTITYDHIDVIDQDGNVIDLNDLTGDKQLVIPSQTVFAKDETVAIYHDDEFVASAVVSADGTIPYNIAHLCEVKISAIDTPKLNEETGKFEISNVSQLFGFALNVNTGVDTYEGKTVVLTADIDLNNSNWTPVGNWDYSFDGNFDGQGYKIKNLKIVDNTAANGEAYVGFFGITANNTIENFTIENVTISSKGQIVAAAIAYPYYTTVKNITVCGNIAITGGNYTAGVLAYTRLCQNVSNLTVSGNAGSYITGAITVGGVIADIQMNKGLVANYSNFSASNVTVTGDKCVGGISGIIGGQTLNGATVENVKLVCSDAHVGVVAGSYDSKPVINNVKTSNVTGATAIAGTPYGADSNGIVIIDGVEYVGNATALIEALENGKDVIFANDIKIEPAKMSNAYGTTGINVKYGQTIDGNGYTLDIKGAGGTWDSGINTTGGVIKNITVTGSFRGIFINHTSTHSEKVVLENVTLTGVTYTISCDQGLYQTIEATNCTFNGWTSFAKTAGTAKFVNCTFGAGNGYKYCRPYSDTEFVNCTFCEGYAVDTTRATVTFTDCTFIGK